MKNFVIYRPTEKTFPDSSERNFSKDIQDAAFFSAEKLAREIAAREVGFSSTKFKFVIFEVLDDPC